MNIYGDMRTCCDCDNKADVVENNKDYCAECWWKKFSNTGTTLNKYEKQKKEQEELENERTVKTDIKRFEEV
ncbi:hypothetical protein [uncultured Mediterranean phage uvMED]|jgi:hypothetical protein|nr:hypothetical protein [uncultured Mediterranean phage uvMED]|tara:strand:+ start:162 stop:377 length:216 start_codon:yes stop_codon:yes gene_type:complete